MNRLVTYIQQSVHELKKVTWPDRKTGMQLTIAVVIFSLVLGAYIGLVDLLYAKVLKTLILKG